MCADTDCPVDDQPPPGETWCIYRLGLELARWVWGYPMECGKAEEVSAWLTPEAHSVTP